MDNNIEAQPLGGNNIGENEINVMTGEQLLNMNLEDVPFLIDPIFHKAGLVCLGGSSDTGKSTLLRQLAIAISTGKEEFLGFKLNTTHKSTIFVSTEDLARETRSSLKKQTENFKPEDLKDIVFLFESENLISKLTKLLEKKPADAVIIDCFSDVFNGEIRDVQSVRRFLQRFQNLALKFDCLLLFLHHTGKRTEELIPSKNNLLGSQGLEAKMRMVMELRTDQNDPLKKHLCIVKGNYIPSSLKQESYVLHFEEDQLLFTNTGEHVPFEFLVKKGDESELREKYKKIIKMKDEGETYAVIAKKFGVTKSTICKWVIKGNENGWNIPIGDILDSDQEEE